MSQGKAGIKEKVFGNLVLTLAEKKQHDNHLQK